MPIHGSQDPIRLHYITHCLTTNHKNSYQSVKTWEEIWNVCGNWADGINRKKLKGNVTRGMV